MPGAAFCHRCRTRVVRQATPTAPGSAQAPAVTPLARRPERPGGVTLVALLDFAAAALALAPAAAVAGTLGTGAGPGSALVAGAGAGALLAGLAVVAGMGLLQLEEFGRRAQLGLGLVGLPIIPVGTTVSILLWVYLTRPGTRLLFSGRSDLSPAEVASLTRATKDQGLAVAGAVLGLAATVMALLLLGSLFLVRVLAAAPAASSVVAG